VKQTKVGGYPGKFDTSIWTAGSGVYPIGDIEYHLKCGLYKTFVVWLFELVMMEEDRWVDIRRVKIRPTKHVVLF